MVSLLLLSLSYYLPPLLLQEAFLGLIFSVTEKTALCCFMFADIMALDLELLQIVLTYRYWDLHVIE